MAGDTNKGKSRAERARKATQPEAVTQVADAVVPTSQYGRPSGYQPEYDRQAAMLAELGATDRELANFFGIHVATLYRWKLDYPSFCDAIKLGGAKADERVKRSLYMRAVGYSFDSEKIMKDGRGAIVRVPVTEHVPPDVTAQIFWLTNRDRDNWRRNADNVETPTTPDGAAGNVGVRELALAVVNMLRAAAKQPGDGAKVIEGKP